MSAILLSIVKWLGVAGCALVLTIVYYEGVPFINQIPFIGSFSLVGRLAQGEMRQFAENEVKLATAGQVAICDARIEKLSSSVELDTAKAQLAETTRQRDAAAQAYTESQRRAAADQKTLQVENEKLESIIAEDSKTPGGNWSADDLRWLCDHGSEAPYCRRSTGAGQGGH